MVFRGLALASCLVALLAVLISPAGDLRAALYEFFDSITVLAGTAVLLLVALYVDRLMVGGWRLVTGKRDRAASWSFRRHEKGRNHS